MPGFPDAPFPMRPFYSCDTDGLAVIDQDDMSKVLRGGEVEAWFRLEAGPGTVTARTMVQEVVRVGTGIRGYQWALWAAAEADAASVA